jgi:hypothetical protein
MIAIAGMLISAIGTALNLHTKYKDLMSWDERDLEVDFDWLTEALKQGVLSGEPNQFGWTRESRVPTGELRKNFETVLAVNAEKRIKYRIVMGQPGDRNILTQKLQLGR